jgi:hypothetical protein
MTNLIVAVLQRSQKTIFPLPHGGSEERTFSRAGKREGSRKGDSSVSPGEELLRAAESSGNHFHRNAPAHRNLLVLWRVGWV